MAVKDSSGKRELRVELAHGPGGVLLCRAWVNEREVPFTAYESNGVYFAGTADLDASLPEPVAQIPADVAAANALSDAEKDKIHQAAEKASAEAEADAKAAAKEEK